MLERLATFTTHPDHHRLFRSKGLFLDWARTYPMLFDEDDLRIAQTQARRGYHFFEWLAAVLLYHNYGYFSLVEKYQFKAHERKRTVLERLVEPQVIQFMQEHPEYGNTQCPDLFVYKPGETEWFFCEVKGPKDALSERQRAFFQALSQISARPVRWVQFQYLPQTSMPG